MDTDREKSYCLVYYYLRESLWNTVLTYCKDVTSCVVKKEIRDIR